MIVSKPRDLNIAIITRGGAATGADQDKLKENIVDTYLMKNEGQAQDELAQPSYHPAQLPPNQYQN